MNFYLVESKDDLQPGAYGILEPTGDHIADGEDGLLIIPGVDVRLRQAVLQPDVQRERRLPLRPSFIMTKL